MGVLGECLNRVSLKNSVVHSVGGGLGTIEDWVSRDLDACGLGWGVRGGNGVFAI